MQIKSLFLSLIIICSSALATLAQSPEGFNYQAIVRDNSGNIIKNKSITVKAIILSGQSASNKIYEETHTVTTNEYGQFSLVVGTGSSSNDFSTISWGSTVHHLKVEIDQGSGYVVMGTVQLQSVPYALHSKTAETVTGLNLSTADISDINSTGAASGTVLKWNGTAWVPGTDDKGTSTTYTAGTGIDVSGTTISAKTSDALWNANKLNGFNLDTKSPSTDQVLKWNGSMWSPGADNSKTYFQGGGITFSNDSIIANFNSALWNANKINGIGVVNGTPSKDQIMKYDGSKWVYANMSGGSSGGTTSQWDTSGNNIYYKKGGNVGINNSNPLSRLSVRDSLTSTASGIFTMVDNYMYGGKGTNARYVGQRTVVFGQGGLQAYGAMNIAAGDIDASGEAIGTYTFSDADGLYNTGTYTFTGADATSQSLGTYSSARASSTFNVGLYANANQSNGNSNYAIFAVGDSASTNYAGYFVGNVNYTGTLTNTSDAKLKYDVNNLTNATTLIKALRPTSYFFKQDGEAGLLNLSEGRQFGFIAQELEEVIPELVIDQVQMKGYKEEGQVEYKAVNYIGLIPVLTQALKEQQALIEALELRIAELELQTK